MMRRAVRESEKAERREALRVAAWRLFQERPYEAIGVGEIADAAGLAKGTLYLYFATKEELFLSVQAQQFAAWFDTLDAALAGLSPANAVDGAVTVIVATVVGAPALVRLFAISHALLERNVGLEPGTEGTARSAIARLKALLHERLLRSGDLLERALPDLRTGDGARTLLHAYALLVGLHGLAEPAPLARAALAADTSLALFQVDFAAELRASLGALLRGAVKGSERAQQG